MRKSSNWIMKPQVGGGENSKNIWGATTKNAGKITEEKTPLHLGGLPVLFEEEMAETPAMKLFL